jgi:hypothetical protein
MREATAADKKQAEIAYRWDKVKRAYVLSAGAAKLVSPAEQSGEIDEGE